jgi:hypothetical protein
MAKFSAMKSTSHARDSSSALLLILGFTASLNAQEVAPAGLRLVNATATNTPLQVHIEGEPLQHRGYRIGEATARLELAPGRCRLELNQSEQGRIFLDLNLEPGVTQVVIAYSQMTDPRKDPVPTPKLTSHVLELAPPEAQTQRRLRVLQMTPLRELDLRLGGRDVRCRRLTLETLLLEHRQPELEHAGQRLGRLPMEESGDGTLILHADSAGRLHHIFFLDPSGSDGSDDRR